MTADPISRSPASSIASFSRSRVPSSSMDVAQPLVRRRARSVVGVGRRREPPLVDAAAMSAERIEIVGVQLEPPTGQHERARHPGWRQAKDAGAGVDRVLNRCAINHSSGASSGRSAGFVRGRYCARRGRGKARRPTPPRFTVKDARRGRLNRLNCLRTHAIDREIPKPGRWSDHPIRRLVLRDAKRRRHAVRRPGAPSECRSCRPRVPARSSPRRRS